MANQPSKYLIVILGPTAVGKTEMGVLLARHFDAQVLSADSRQLYREMRIGTALPDRDQLGGVMHHFLGNLSIHEDYNVFRYEQEAIELLGNIYLEHDIALLVGGSGLYIDAVLNGIDELPDADPALRARLKYILNHEGLEPLRIKLKEMDPGYYKEVDLNNPNRIMRALEVCMITGKTFSALRKSTSKDRGFIDIRIGLNLPREELFSRINQRVEKMIAEGLLEEVKSLYSHRDLNALKTVGYAELFHHLEGRMSLRDAVEKIKTNTRRYAKRQLTWFKRDPSISWFRPDEHKSILSHIENQLANSQ